MKKQKSENHATKKQVRIYEDVGPAEDQDSEHAGPRSDHTGNFIDLANAEKDDFDTESNYKKQGSMLPTDLLRNISSSKTPTHGAAGTKASENINDMVYLLSSDEAQRSTAAFKKKANDILGQVRQQTSKLYDQENAGASKTNVANMDIRSSLNIIQVNILGCKTNIIQNNLHAANENLAVCDILISALQKKSLSIVEMKKTLASFGQLRSQQKQIIGDGQSSEALKRGGKSQRGMIFSEYRFLLQCQAVIAALYDEIGNDQKCESAYANYVHLIERFYLKNSLETSNAYYLVGVYYYEQNVANKAAACFQKCLAIRKARLGDSHQSCSDCLLNLGIIYKQQGYFQRAQLAYNECIGIRKVAIGHDSKEVAHALEELGKLFIQESRFEEAFEVVKECFTIRTKIRVEKDEIQRASQLLGYLKQKIQDQLTHIAQIQSQGGSHVMVQDNNTTVSIGKGFNLNDSFSELQEAGLGGLAMHQVFKKEIYKQEVEAFSKAQESADDSFDVPKMPNLKAIAEQISVQHKFKETPPLQEISSQSNTEQESMSVDLDLSKLITDQLNQKPESNSQIAMTCAIALLLSFDQDQVEELWLIQTNNISDPLFFSDELVQTFNPMQEALFAESRIWQIPGSSMMLDRPDRANVAIRKILKIPEQSNSLLFKQEAIDDQQIFKLLQTKPGFVRSLNDGQKQVFQSVLLQNFLLKYFLVTVTKEQLLLLESPLTRFVQALPTLNDKPALDYRTETYIIICAFQHVSDFAVFNPEYEINMDEDLEDMSGYEKEQLLDSMQQYNDILENESDCHSVDYLKGILEQLVKCLNTQKAYIVFVTFWQQFRQIRTQKINESSSNSSYLSSHAKTPALTLHLVSDSPIKNNEAKQRPSALIRRGSILERHQVQKNKTIEMTNKTDMAQQSQSTAQLQVAIAVTSRKSSTSKEETFKTDSDFTSDDEHRITKVVETNESLRQDVEYLQQMSRK